MGLVGCFWLAAPKSFPFIGYQTRLKIRILTCPRIIRMVLGMKIISCRNGLWGEFPMLMVTTLRFSCEVLPLPWQLTTLLVAQRVDGFLVGGSG